VRPRRPRGSAARRRRTPTTPAMSSTAKTQGCGEHAVAVGGAGELVESDLAITAVCGGGSTMGAVHPFRSSGPAQERSRCGPTPPPRPNAGARVLLVVHGEPGDHDDQLRRIFDAVEEAEVVIVVPTVPSGRALDHRPRPREARARSRLERWTGALADHARGEIEIGDPRSRLAIADALHDFPADTVITTPANATARRQSRGGS
jgi:hypothetical protein